MVLVFSQYDPAVSHRRDRGISEEILRMNGGAHPGLHCEALEE